MKNKTLSIMLILISIIFFQCRKELSYIGQPDPGVSVNPDPISANIQGNIIDENDQPAAGVTITAGLSSAITDVNGFFHINKASLDKNTSFVTAEKDGYFKAYRVFAATSGCNQVIIKLIKKDLTGTISSTSGGEVSLSNGSKISLPANSVINASSGNDYSGDIKVYASYINPKSSDINKTVPGSFVANDKNNKRVLLSSYGMLAVELQSSSGEKLQIKNGAAATLSFLISSNISAAPSTISLWYVDEKTGIWQEEGEATKNGNMYTGTVKHFSFWNCDVPMDAVNLSMTLKLSDSVPLVNATVKVSARDPGVTSAYGWTDSLGQVKGLVPANKELQIDVLDNCGTSIYTKTISPLTKDEDLGVLFVPASPSNTINFMGLLVDCNGNTVKNGYAIITFNGMTRYVASNPYGYFYTYFSTCNNTSANFTVLGVDEDAMQQGVQVNIPAVSPVTDGGNIVACGNVFTQQYINFSFDTSQFKVVASSTDTFAIHGFRNNSSTYISGNSFDTSTNIQFNISGISLGTFPITKLSVLGYYDVSPDASSTATFTTYANNIGEFYEGTFSAKFTDSTTNKHTVTGTFKAIRTQ